MSKSLIVITGLMEKFNGVVATLICEKLGMYFLDVSQLYEFEIAQKDEVILKCGIDYLKKLESKLIDSVTGYENTVVLMSYDLYVSNGNYKKFSPKAYTFYIKFPKSFFEQENSNIINKIAYIDRDKFLTDNCECIISLRGRHHNKALKEIIKYLKDVAI